jgi:hypothetical protein
MSYQGGPGKSFSRLSGCSDAGASQVEVVSDFISNALISICKIQRYKNRLLFTAIENTDPVLKGKL